MDDHMDTSPIPSQHNLTSIQHPEMDDQSYSEIEDNISQTQPISRNEDLRNMISLDNNLTNKINNDN